MMWFPSVSPGRAAVWIAISSIYTIMLLSVIRLRNIVFIMVWNVMGELVSPKNIMVGSYSPLFVVNTAFH